VEEDGGDGCGDVPQAPGGGGGGRQRGAAAARCCEGRGGAREGACEAGLDHAAHEVQGRGVRADEGGGWSSHAVLPWVWAAVLLPDDGGDGQGGAAGGGGVDDAGGRGGAWDVACEAGLDKAAQEVQGRGVRADEGGGRSSHAVLPGVSGAVLLPDDGRDGRGEAAGGGGDGDAGRHRADGDRVDHAD